VSFADEIRRGSGDLRKMLTDIGGAKTLSKKGALVVGPLRPGQQQRTAPSAPGEAPRRQKGRAIKSIGQEVVGGVLRVGTSSFVLRILEEGTSHATRTAKADGKRSHKRKAPKRSRVTIGARPWAAKSLEAALPAMEGEFVGELQKRTGGG